MAREHPGPATSRAPTTDRRRGWHRPGSRDHDRHERRGDVPGPDDAQAAPPHRASPGPARPPAEGFCPPGRTKRAIARGHARLADRRRDWVEKLTTRVVRVHDVVVLEALRTKDMARRPRPRPDPERPGAFLPNGARAKAGLNRAIHRSAWVLLERRLVDKARRAASRSSSSTQPTPPSSAGRAAIPPRRTARAKRPSPAVPAATATTPTATQERTSGPGGSPPSRPPRGPGRQRAQFAHRAQREPPERPHGRPPGNSTASAVGGGQRRDLRSWGRRGNVHYNAGDCPPSPRGPEVIRGGRPPSIAGQSVWMRKRRGFVEEAAPEPEQVESLSAPARR